MDCLPNKPDGVNEFIERLTREIRAMAEALFRGERAGHTLSPTAMVNEVWIRMTEGRTPPFDSDGEFLAYVARAMRHMLVDHARRRSAERRGGDWVRCDVSLDEIVILGEGAASAGTGYSLLEIDEELRLLETSDPVSARAFELRFFGGMTCAAAGERLGLSGRRVQDYTEAARCWLLDRLDGRRQTHR